MSIRCSSFHRMVALLAFVILPCSVHAQISSSNISPRIAQAIDTRQAVILRGNTHPLARAEFDRGAAPTDLRLDRMLLVLKRSPEQESALRRLLDEQQDKSSPNYRHWLTPEQFGQQFGPADSDIQKISDWLQSQGFQNIRVSKGRTLIEFSGSAGQVQQTLGTAIRKFVVNGEEHFANATDPEIPAALSPVVEGVLTLHNFYKRPQVHTIPQQIIAKVKVGAAPEFTSTTGGHALLPADYYTIYNFNPRQIAPGANASAKIAIVGRSNINLQDIGYFHFWTNDQASTPQIIVNGPDPGDLGGAEETEAVLDTTWAGAVASTSAVVFVVSASTTTTDGVDLSELYIIDNNLADVMSESFGECEANFTSAQAAGISSLAQQAAAQGITYVISSGDSGSAGCDNPHTETMAAHPASVNVLASSPYVVAVGGTMFNENGHPATYWKATNDPSTNESAISYIPENVWNESCAAGQAGCSTGNIWAGGGGASTFFAKPSWQSGVSGIPADNARDLPDVSLTAAAHDPYLLCLRGSCVPNAQGQISFAGVSGTSASAPAFAGIMALVMLKTQVRLGQPNYVLYRLAAAENLSQCNASSTTSLPGSTCVFNDVTAGNNAVPGETGYGTASAKYGSGSGYDMATGLGSVNVTNLMNQWNSVTFSPTTTTFSISPTTATHGDALNVAVNVTANSGTGKPSGRVWLLQVNQYAFITGSNTADTFTLDAQGAFTGVTHLLPGGTYQVNAHYVGDGTYGGSDSAPPVQVTVQPENTTITFAVLTKDSSGNLVPFSAGPYGTAVYFQAHVSGQSGYGAPGAYVNFWDNNGFGSSAYLDKQGNALAPPLTQLAAGAHAITAGYYGDNSFNSSSNLTPINFAITQLSTATTLTSQQSAQNFVLTATVSTPGGAGPTGLVTFRNGSTVMGTASFSNVTTAGGTTQATATFDGTQLPAGQYNVTASYPGDTNYTASVSANLTVSLSADFSVSDRGITSQTVVAGQTASYINDLAVTPFFGFASDVTLSCSVPAQGTACSVNPTSLSTTSGVNIATLAVTTKGHTGAEFGAPQEPWQLWPLAWGVATWGLLWVLVFGVTRDLRRRIAGTVAAGILTLAALVVMAGCGGGGGSAGGSVPPPTTQTGTPTGTYTVTVTGTAGSVTHTATLTLVVQ